MKCEHCGWDDVDEAPKKVRLDNWPKGMPQPPVNLHIESHPDGKCFSPLKIGDKIYWSGHGQDVAPITGTFVRVTEFCGADFVLEGETWRQVSLPAPSKAQVVVENEKKSVILVAFQDLTLIEKWPVLT